MINEDYDILTFLCTSNGIDINSNGIERSRIERLETFFSGFPKIISLSTFPNLCELIIINQQIKVIENLDTCINLTSLWICECEITEIQGLDQCGQIRHLYLYDNKINKIKNLDPLRLLECLWLNNNQIEVIEGLDELMILDELNLAGNKIQTIGSSLKSNISIEKLNLSGNDIWDLYDVLNLSHLPKLKHMIINGPDYTPNPIFSVTNYFLFILYHFVNLKTLDTFDVNCSYLRDVVLNIVVKKKLFYVMKKETLSRSCESKKLQLKKSNKELLSKYEVTVRNLNFLIKLIEQKLMIASEEIFNAGDTCDVKKDYFEENLKSIKLKCHDLEEKCDVIQNEFDYYEYKVEVQKNEITDLHQMELSSCGNFKFELSSDKIWVNLCNELLNSRFCNNEFLYGNFTKIQAQRVIKIKDIQIDRSYNKRINELMNKKDLNGCRDIGDSGAQDYLFLFVEENDNRGLAEILDSLYRNTNGVIKLTNSLFYGDIYRNTKKKLQNAHYGRVIIVKTLIGQTKTEEQFGNRNDAKFESYCVPLMNCPYKNICTCRNYKYEWYFKSNALLVPEYIVDYEYVMKDGIHRPHFYSVFHECKDTMVTECDDMIDTDKNFDDIKREMESESLNRRSLSFFKEIEDVEIRTKISTLNLTNCQLRSIAEIGCLDNLTILVIPFNQLVDLKDISNRKLKTLDVSFNNVQTLDSMHDLLSLKVFYLQHNFLLKTAEEISFLHNHVPNVTDLNLKDNYFQKPKTVRLRIIGKLKYLKILNEIEVTEHELKSAVDLAFKSRITESDIVEYGRIDTIKPRTLIMDNVASILLHHSDKKLANPVNDFSKFLRITSLSLDNQNIARISNIDKLENLKYLSLTDNYISKIEGLDHCGHLEELILDYNTIDKIENLSRLQKLKKLSLNVNYINSVSHLRNVPNLQVLSMHTNLLVSLSGVEFCDALSELFVANNFISDSSEITNLKTLNNLIILDLYNNPIIENSKNYRLNVVYHLKNLKALDGICVDSAEINQSKEVLGGRLNLDFIREKIGSENFSNIVELDLANCGIKSVDLSPIERLRNVRSLNLENNNLSSFSGLIHLSQLKVLCLNSNVVESIVPRHSSKVIGIQPAHKYDADRNVHLNSLEVLHLGYNNIKHLGQLGLHDIPSLKALFLQGNDISSIEGLENLTNLRELVLDQNRIKFISEQALASNINLREVHLEDNRLKTVGSVYHLKHLKRLYVGNNKISDLQDLDMFYCFESLLDVSLFGNPVCRKHLHRQYLIHLVPSLLMIDGLDVTEEEKLKLEISLEETDGNTLPGIMIHNKVPGLKHNSVFGDQCDLGKSDFLKGDNFKRRANALNLVNKTPGMQLVSNTKTVYFYDPIGQSESAPRLYSNKKK